MLGKPLSLKRKLYVVGSFIVLFLAILEVTGVIHVFHKKHVSYVSTPTTGGGSANEQKGEPQATTNTQSQPSPSTSQPGDNKSNTGGANPTILVAPSGDFVSNHHPGQNGSPLTETSVCNTTPGATCQITFTKDGVTKSLALQATDRGGSTYWNNWTPASIGLTTGSWQIQAIATLNGQTKTTIDSIVLVISS